MSLSVCMIVKNEERNLARSLYCAARIADEIVVVDTGSTDKTKQIARQFTDKVFDFEWCDNFAAARNFSVDKATCDYIMWLDADDSIPELSIIDILNLKERFDPNTAYYVKALNINAPPSEPSSFAHIRIFPRDERIRFSGRLHEQLSESLIKNKFSIIGSGIEIHHNGYMDKAIRAEKHKRNIRILLTDDIFPSDTVFHIVDVGAYTLFYAPNALTVWKAFNMIGCCDPFDVPLEDTRSEDRILQRGMDIIKAYERNAKPVEAQLDDMFARFEETLSRMNNVAELTKV